MFIISLLGCHAILKMNATNIDFFDQINMEQIIGMNWNQHP